MVSRGGDGSKAKKGKNKKSFGYPTKKNWPGPDGPNTSSWCERLLGWARSTTVRDSLLGPKRIIECSPPTYCGDEVGFSLPKTERKKREGERDFLREEFLMNYIVIRKILGTLLVESVVFFL